MKRLLLLLALLASAAQAEPQSLKDGQVIRGKFTQERHLQGFANPVKSDGHFVLAAGRGLIWVAEHPFPVTTLITADGLAQSVNGKQTARLDAQRIPFLAKLYTMMSSALAGNWASLEGDFSVRHEGSRITLIPLHADTGMAIKSIALTVTRFVDQADIEKPGGDVDHLAFTDQTLSSGPLTAEESAALDQLHP